MNPIALIFVVSFTVASAASDKYEVLLPAVGGDVSTTAEVITNDEKQTIHATVKDTTKAAGGVSLIDFINRVLVVLSTDRTRCSVYQFLTITYNQTKNLLSKAPGTDGKIRGVYCNVKQISAPNYDGISDAEKKACGVSSRNVTVSKVSDCSESDAGAQVKYPFSILCGVFWDKGFAAFQGGNLTST